MSSLKDQILKLRDQGLSYRQICKEVNCSKGAVSYHLGDGQKEKAKTRLQKNRKLNPLAKKLETFKEEKIKSKTKNQVCNTNRLLYMKLREFLKPHRWKKLKKEERFSMDSTNLTVEDVITKIGANPICYLTGEPIDISSPRTYQFDHITPRSKGGTNTLDNLGICTKVANSSKTDMTKDEYIEHCKKVLLHNGYNVEKL